MTLDELCTKINLQPEMTAKVLGCEKNMTGQSAVREAMALLFVPETWSTGLDLLGSNLGNDPDGSKILCCMLLCGIHTHRLYREKGIDDEIFTATFKCFPRFIEEHKTSYGTYAFDRGWWTSRQISLKLFRLGELEYELPRSAQDNAVHIHIPSHAKLSPELLAASHRKAVTFLQMHYPEYAEAPMVCSSWMLSPALKKLLPETSRLVRFSSAFVLEKWEETKEDYKEWVFKNPALTLADLPEDTTLQRSMKRYLEQGGNIGVGIGWLTGF